MAVVRQLWDRLFRRAPVAVDGNFVDFPKYRRMGAYHWPLYVDDPVYRAHVDWVSKHASSNSTCLDLGCGDGAVMGALSADVRFVDGVDGDAEGVRLANEAFASRGMSNCRARQATFGNLACLESEKFDLVYSLDVLEHLPQPRELFESARRHCEPDGKIVIGTPIFLSRELVSPYHVKEYLVEELDAMCSEHLDKWSRELLPSTRGDGKTRSATYYLCVGSPKITDVSST